MKIIKKVFNWLGEYDFVWSIPLAFLSFVLFPILGENIWGDDFAFYPPEFFHAAIYAGLIVVFFNSMVQLGIRINFPELYKYYLDDNFNELPTWQKAVIFLSVYFFFYCSLVWIWAQMV
jgi:hypothetical protein